MWDIRSWAELQVYNFKVKVIYLYVESGCKTHLFSTGEILRWHCAKIFTASIWVMSQQEHECNCKTSDYFITKSEKVKVLWVLSIWGMAEVAQETSCLVGCHHWCIKGVAGSKITVTVVNGVVEQTSIYMLCNNAITDCSTKSLHLQLTQS